MTLEQRIQRLELANRRYKLVLLGFSALFGACAGVQATYERVAVRRLEIIDANEHVVATWIGGPSGAELTLLDAAGRPAFRLNANGVKPAFRE